MRRHLDWSTVLLVCLCFWLFSIPTNLFFKFGENQAYVHGLLSDYLLPKIYLSDLFSVTLVGLSWWPLLKTSTFKHSRWQVVLLGMVALIGLRQFFTPHPLAAFSGLLHLLTVGLLVIGLNSQLWLLKKSQVLYALLVTIFFQFSLALYQFFAQKSLWGYHFLGEPDLRRGIGLATGVFDGAEKTLPYGTTAHPNVLAGMMAVYSLGAVLLYFHQKQKSVVLKTLVGLALLCAVTTIYLTQSWGAGLAMVVGSLLILFRQTSLKKYVWLLVVVSVVLSPFVIAYAAHQYPRSLSLSRREFLNRAGFSAWQSQPLFGVGLNQTTAVIERFSPSIEIVRFVQPTHHVGLLWLTEAGALGLIVLGFYVAHYGRKSYVLALVFLLPILVTDHYLLTLTTGQLLFGLSLWLSTLLDTGHSLKNARV